MKHLTTISLIALFATPALALTPEQIAQQQLVIQQQQEQALQNERNRNWFKGGNANIDSNSYEKAASQGAKDRMIQEGIFDLKNYGNENTNTMDSSQWLSNYENSDTIQNGSLSLVSDAVNSSVGNGVGKGELISIGTLATVAVASYYGTKYVGSKIEQQDGESYGDAKKRFQENNPLFAVDEKFGELVITGVAGGADYISGDLQLGTKTLVKVGEGYEWLDNKTGGNLEEILDVGAIVAAAGTATKATSSTAKVAGKVDDAADAAKTMVKNPSTPIGSKGYPLDVAPGTNTPGIVDGIKYTGHAFDQMQADGIMPSVVKDIIDNVEPIKGKNPGTNAYYSPTNNVTVITNAKGEIVTVSRGEIRQ